MLQTLDIPDNLDNYINLKSFQNLLKISINKFYVNSVCTKICHTRAEHNLKKIKLFENMKNP